jgi:hypothetical protein
LCAHQLLPFMQYQERAQQSMQSKGGTTRAQSLRKREIHFGTIPPVR